MKVYQGRKIRQNMVTTNKETVKTKSTGAILGMSTSPFFPSEMYIKMQFSSCFFTSQDRSKIKWCLLFCFPRMMAVLAAGCSSFLFLTRHQTRNNINIELKGRCKKYLASGNFHPSPLRNNMSCSYFRLTF